MTVDKDVWIFGYGSLIWKVDFPVVERKPGYIRGFQRRFWQSSNDHRGTPESPGRVVTLIPTDIWKAKYRHLEETEHQDDGVTWGVAYRIAASEASEVLKHLDHREKNGYSTHIVEVHCEDSTTGETTGSIQGALVYIGTEQNEAFVGPPKSLDELALHIHKSRGPSGFNRDYLLNLASALRQLGPHAHDVHTEALENRIIKLMQTDLPN
ncbi:cation transport regulator-like protein 2-like protein [Ramicandelaber brevisporus]|nr:cation transport regulator-like protein 2-like protein [Ramicandelaber brevisporus]